MLIATAHGNSLESLIKNPTLSDLVGGIQSVTLGDDEAKRRASQKTVLEREKQPTFDIVIEIIDRNTLAVYKNTSEAVDYILRGWPIRPELRKVDKSYTDKVEEIKPVVEQPKVVEPVKTAEENPMNFSFSRQNYCEQNKPLRKVYLYAVSRTIVEKIIERLDFNVEITRNVDDADIVLAHKNFAKGGAKVLNTAKEYRAQIFYVKTNSMAQIQKVLKDALDIRPYDNPEDTGYNDETENALNEAQNAISQIMNGANCVELSPQNTNIRKLQHELVEQYGYQSTSIGEGENRHLRISK
jgi:predicted RNA-binding protein Jag